MAASPAPPAAAALLLLLLLLLRGRLQLAIGPVGSGSMGRRGPRRLLITHLHTRLLPLLLIVAGRLGHAGRWEYWVLRR